jgi:spoIIIJ-associated protein
MDEKNNSEKEIKEAMEMLLEKTGFSGSVEVKKYLAEDRETVECNIQTEESNFLIGQYGVNLQALQHISRVVLRKLLSEKINFLLDVNSYRKEKNSSIERMARDFAEQALSEKRAVIMRPMTPYERRIVHMELCKNTQVKTESIGEGEDRKVVVKPADML